MARAGYAKQSFLESLSEPERRALLEIGHRRRWQRGDVLVHAGDRADSAIVVLSGLVKIHKLAAEGADVLLALCGPGDLLGEIGAVREAVRAASATAVDLVDAMVIPVRDLRSFLAAHPDTMLALLDLTLHRLYDSDERRIEFATAESLARVSSRLVELAERFGEPSQIGVIDVVLPVSQEELASWSGSSRESTARALRTLRGLGLIQTQRLRLRVVDLDGLRSHAARL